MRKLQELMMRGKSVQARKKPSAEAEQRDLFEVAS